MPTEMLREVTKARQVPGEPRRRWFSSADCDLIVWVDAAGGVLGFQFCYDKATREQTFTWKAPENRASEGAFDRQRVVELFRAESAQVPAAYVQLVVDSILSQGENA